MKRILIGIFIGTVAFAGAAIAQDGPIKERQELMKKTGGASKTVGEMLKGEKPYDAAAAEAAAKTVAGGMDTFATLFPEGSTSEDSSAKPEIWENKKDFEDWASSLKTAAMKAAEAAPGGMDGFKTAWAEVGKHCKGCHEKYRAEKKK